MFASTINVSKYLRINCSLFQTEDDSDTETLELAVVNGLGPIISLTIANSLNVAAEAYGDRSMLSFGSEAHIQFWQNSNVERCRGLQIPHVPLSIPRRLRGPTSLSLPPATKYAHSRIKLLYGRP